MDEQGLKRISLCVYLGDLSTRSTQRLHREKPKLDHDEVAKK
jgi:hypothetical protein